MIWRAQTDADVERALAIREKVFVGEQKVPIELEHDQHDWTALHFLAGESSGVVGTARLVKDYPEAGQGKVGRVAVLPEARGSGWGRRLMWAMQAAAREHGLRELVLDSQLDAVPFYQGLGYTEQGEVFEEAGILHRRMTLCLP